MLWGSSGQPPLFLDPSLSVCVCPSGYFEVLWVVSEARKRQGAGRALLSTVLSFSSTTFMGSCGRKDILLTDRPSRGKAVIQTPEPWWGKSSLLLLPARVECTFCALVVETRENTWSTAVKQKLLLRRTATEIRQPLFFLSDIWPTQTLIADIFIHPRKKEKLFILGHTIHAAWCRVEYPSFILPRQYLHFSHQHCVLKGRMKYAAPQEQKSSW